MTATLRQRASWTGWALIALLCVLYGPMAIEFTWRLFHPGSPELWNHAFGAVTTHDEAYGAGSIHHEQAEVYADQRVTLLLHTTSGGVAILLFAAQFSQRFRRNLRRHRIVGRVAVTLSLVAAFGAMVYLLAVGPEDTFDGPSFYLQLWALALGTAIATAIGFVAAWKRQIPMHQAFMALAFSYLLTAPLLRVGYMVLGRAWPDSSQWETNLAGGAILGVWAPFGAFLAARTLAGSRRRDPSIGTLPGRWVELASGAVALVAAVLLVVRFEDQIGSLDRITTSGLIAYALGIAVVAANLVASHRAGATTAAEDWRVMANAFALALPATLGLWVAYDAFFPHVDSYLGALLTGPPLALSLGYLVLVRRRRIVRVLA